MLRESEMDARVKPAHDEGEVGSSIEQNPR
jgi:hypothetical protein